MSSLISKYRSGLLNKEYKKRLPFIYITGLIISFIIFLLYIPFPFLISCLVIAGNKVCSPTGSFIAMFISLPGYVIANLLPKFITGSYWVVSFVIVIVISGLFYGLVGLYIDFIRSRNKKNKLILTYISIFSVLAIIALYLLGASLSI